MTTTMKTAAPPLAVRDIMSPDVVTLSPDMSLREAIEILADEQISGAPVVAGGAVVGVVSASDVLAFDAETPPAQPGRPEEPEPEAPEVADELVTPDDWQEAEPSSAYFTELWEDAAADDVVERIRQAEGPELDALTEHTVGEAMTPGVRCVQAGASLAEAAAYMLERKIHRAIVLDDERFVGIVTATDFMRAVAEHGLSGGPS